MNYPADSHVHSTFSGDARDSMEAMCRSAVSRGLRYISFTEHLDLNPHDGEYGFFNYPGFTAAIDSARAEFGAQIVILKGLEFGEPHCFPHALAEWNKLDFDLILGAVHVIDDLFVGDPNLLTRYSMEELLEQYLQEVLKTVRGGGFDVLAHLDFPKRYLGKNPGVQKLFPDLTGEILAELVRREIALEINTSPLRKGLGECSPDLPVVQEYLRRGGSRLTIGSDAHCGADVRAEWEQILALLAKNGIPSEFLGVFQKRRFVPVGQNKGFRWTEPAKKEE